VQSPDKKMENKKQVTDLKVGSDGLVLCYLSSLAQSVSESSAARLFPLMCI